MNGESGINFFKTPYQYANKETEKYTRLFIGLFAYRHIDSLALTFSKAPIAALVFKTAYKNNRPLQFQLGADEIFGAFRPGNL